MHKNVIEYKKYKIFPPISSRYEEHMCALFNTQSCSVELLLIGGYDAVVTGEDRSVFSSDILRGGDL